jgi:flagellar hook-associated protein 2
MIKLNGLAAVGITIDPGTYTPDQVASLLQQKINTTPGFKGNFVSVGLTPDNKLTITSQEYGAASKIQFAGGSALADLGFTGTESGTGTNVAGNFVVGGLTEAATGSGQTLTGAADNANTSGLQVRATLGTAGTADLTVTQGFAARLNNVLTKYLDTTDGRLVGLEKSFKTEIEGIDETIAEQNELMTEKTDQLTRQFAAMEKAVSNLKGLQSQLTALIPTMVLTGR